MFDFYTPSIYAYGGHNIVPNITPSYTDTLGLGGSFFNFSGMGFDTGQLFSPSFFDMDLNAILAKTQPFIDNLYPQTPTSFDLGQPNVVNTKSRLLGMIKPKYKKLSPECKKQIEAMANEVKCSPKDIEALIYAESKGDPTAFYEDKYGGASGLIQFRETTAKSLGTTGAAIRKMSAEEQMPLVKEYLLKMKRTYKFSPQDKIDGGTLYALVFLPAFAKREVLCSRGSGFYDNVNGRNLDKDHDGRITKADLAKQLSLFRPKDA